MDWNYSLVFLGITCVLVAAASWAGWLVAGARRDGRRDVVLTLILLILALVCFVLAALQVPSPRVSLVPLGLALWVLSLVLR